VLLLRAYYIITINADFICFDPVYLCFLHLCTYQIIILKIVLLISAVLICYPFSFDIILVLLIDMSEGLCVGRLSELIIHIL